MSSGSDDKKVLAEYLSVRTPPANIEKKDEPMFAREWQKTMPAVVLKQLRHVTISPAGVLSRGSLILPETWGAAGSMSWRSQVRFLAHRFLPKKEVQFDGAVWFTWPGSLSGFHWFMDSLARLMAVRSQFKCPTLLLPAACRNNSFIAASLRVFEPYRVVYVPPYRNLQCPELHVPTTTAPTGNFRDPLIREMRHLYRTQLVTPGHSHLGDRIYASRGKARMRKISNESEVESILKKHGFKTVYFEDYSFEAQVAIAGHARYFVSNHGAGLTNMLFMPPGSRVFEIRQAGDCYRNCYFSMASALQLGYFYQLCEPPFDLKDFNRDVSVDCRTLEENVLKLLSEDAVSGEYSC